MATRIRLQRHGKKNQPFYHIVIADGRAPRDGRFIEKIGTYNPLTHPATININFDRALYWVETGASPSDTVRALLKKEGVYLMKHLRGGIAKGALTEMDAERKFDAWKQDKESKLSNEQRNKQDKERAELKKRIEAETKVREAISAKVAAKYAQEAAEAAKATAEAEETEAAEVEETTDATVEVAEETPETTEE
ncbi:30S ribosomal protein S16 [Bacteroidales bacterium OttesenSCG-928-B11]|nr:30S ribosomal protein S16 [Bacteroidales bacterium OttesenSCG-928-E04]MDL2308096.1 30S ribosomal protein S16 [Bacteroidales bacterium OttesenSCG-928-C03]MDL2311620.1 30S ribosomal protein S16 [Bacteroidales bacterium OttesenSCG-928-B11]